MPDVAYTPSNEASLSLVSYFYNATSRGRDKITKAGAPWDYNFQASVIILEKYRPILIYTYLYNYTYDSIKIIIMIINDRLIIIIIIMRVIEEEV